MKRLTALGRFCCALLLALIAGLAPAGSVPVFAATWTPQSSGTTQQVIGIACPSPTTCFSVGSSGTILATTNGGGTWTPQTSGTTNDLDGIACPSTTTCIATGFNGTIVATINGGATWTPQTSGTTHDLYSVTCPSSADCFAAGFTGTILATTNGGGTWTPQTSGTILDLFGIACPSTTSCIVTGSTGTILATSNGGGAWTPQTSGTTKTLFGIACRSATDCIAVGDLGTIVSTTNGGTTWSAQTSGTTDSLNDIACPGPTTCIVVDQVGGILATTNAGTTWTPQTSGTLMSLFRIACPSTVSCFAVGDVGTILHGTEGETTPPTCAITSVIPGAPRKFQFSVQDSNGGLAAPPTGIVVTAQSNAAVQLPSYSAGVTTPLTVTATIANPARPAQVALQLTDLSGNQATCDLTRLAVGDGPGQPERQTVGNLSGTDRYVTVRTGAQGSRTLTLTIVVNGTPFGTLTLHSNEVRPVDVGALLHAGNTNTIAFQADGPARSLAQVTISNLP